jgi:hypothetical protein
MIIKLPVFILAWIGFLCIKIPTILLGPLVVAYLYKRRNTDYDVMVEELPWLRPWINPEDWKGGPNSFSDSLPKWWFTSKGGEFKSFWHYHAIRNPANGLRSIEWLDLDIIPELVKFKTNLLLPTYEPNAVRVIGKDLSWYIAWQGLQAGIKVIYIWSADRHLVLKLGWRVEPSDSFSQSTHDMGIEDASFATKFLPYRRG